MLGMARWGAGWVMPLLRPALYLLALTSVLLLLLSAVDMEQDIIDGVSAPPPRN